MTAVSDYVARIDGTCGEEKDVIVTFRYNKKDEAMKKIMERARLAKSYSQLIFELTLDRASIRLYSSGRAIFRNVKNRDELDRILSELLL